MFCALAFGALRAAAYPGQVQQRSRGLFQLVVQLHLDLVAGPFADGPLKGGRAARGQLHTLLIPQVHVLLTVETLAAGAHRLGALTALFLQRGQ